MRSQPRVHPLLWGVWGGGPLIWVYCSCLRAWLSLTLCDPLDCSPTRLLCLWDFPGKNTEVGCHFVLQWTFPPRDQTCISYVSCIIGRFFLTWVIGETQAYCCWTNSVKRYLYPTNCACLTYETNILLVRVAKAPSCSRLGHWFLLFSKEHVSKQRKRRKSTSVRNTGSSMPTTAQRGNLS